MRRYGKIVAQHRVEIGVGNRSSSKMFKKTPDRRLAFDGVLRTETRNQFEKQSPGHRPCLIVADQGSRRHKINPRQRRVAVCPQIIAEDEA